METITNVLDYGEIVNSDKNKNYLDILPEDIVSKKKSIISLNILYPLERLEEMIKGNKQLQDLISINRLLRYAMFYSKNYDLASKFYNEYKIPFYINDNILDEFRKHVAILRQGYEAYNNKKSVKNGELVHSWDMESDGYPSTSRGSSCYLFIPIKGDFPENKTGNWLLHNPRTKKDVTYEILGYKNEDYIYKCKDPKGKIVFFMAYSSVAGSYSDLFDINKEIYTGWQKKVLISK